MNNSNQIIIATAVVGGLLIGAPDAMAQGTYSSNTTTVTTVTTQATTAINQVNPATGVTATQPIATTLTSTTGTSAVVVTAPGANVQVGKDAAGNVLTAIGSGASATLVTGATAPTVNTATTGAGTTATVIVPTTNAGTVSVASSATNVAVTATGTVATTVTVGTATAPITLQSASTTAPLVLTGVNAPSQTVTVNTGIVTVQSGSTLSAPSGLTIASGAVFGGGGTISNTPINLSQGGALRTGAAPTYGFYSGSGTQLTLGNTNAGGLLADIDGTTAATLTNGGGAGKYGVIDLQNGAGIALTGPVKPTLGADAFNVAGDPASSGYKNPVVGTGYTIITADRSGVITGQFTGIGVVGGRDLTGATGTTPASMLANTTFDVVYADKSVTLYVTPSKYQNLASSRVSLSTNQTNSATALQSVRDIYKPLGVERISNTDLKSLFDNLAPQSAGNLQSIYDQISGASIATLGTQSVRTANVVTDAFTARASHERTLAQTGIAKTASLGLAGGDVDGANRGDRGWSAWVQPIGQIGSVDSDGTGPGYSHSTIGALAGIEGRVRNAVFGFGYGYARDTLDFNNFDNKTDVDNHILSAYGEYAANNLFVNGTLGYTWKNVDEKRNIAIGNSYSKTATGKTDGSNFNVAGSVGYTFTPNTVIVEPSLGLRYNAFSLDGFTETGAGPLNLRVGKQDYDSLQSLLSVRIARPFTTDSGMKVVPEVRVGWQHEILDNRSTITSAFTSGGSSFSSTGSRVGDDAAVIGLGVRAQLTGSFDVFANYDARIGSKQIENGMTAGMKYKF